MERAAESFAGGFTFAGEDEGCGKIGPTLRRTGEVHIAFSESFRADLTEGKQDTVKIMNRDEMTFPNTIQPFTIFFSMNRIVLVLHIYCRKINHFVAFKQKDVDGVFFS
ncbi:Hypothetical predicted protein [Octopus vulgaris]|uniref:Uncharacterized protein n=1 Tax=Octopus vulgaris TaxID=6645 RepID=A0AA36FA65_OCTVU|nr:Hypothetical predicted protein [Octopus vulgaris]